ncbi:hypothetical protein CEXT_743441 [Caerostris extrusa]|uniref:Uncharacterized protein n=1 Tax=Caerostris extrusa TaxID=172846 RepID=A0AAV4TBA1_CAEEX|nr:hypothetical protein CEXT_743441 [Caerostris extrusa]
MSSGKSRRIFERRTSEETGGDRLRPSNRVLYSGDSSLLIQKLCLHRQHEGERFRTVFQTCCPYCRLRTTSMVGFTTIKPPSTHWLICEFAN